MYLSLYLNTNTSLKVIHPSRVIKPVYMIQHTATHNFTAQILSGDYFQLAISRRQALFSLKLSVEFYYCEFYGA